MKTRIGLVAVLLACVLVRADDPGPVAAPKSLAARTAIAKFEKARADLDKVRDRAVNDARLKLLGELKAAQKTALQNGDQGEAVALAGKIKETEDALAASDPHDDLKAYFATPRNLTYGFCDARTLELLPGGRVGSGSMPCERSWAIKTDDSGRQHLVLSGEGGQVVLTEAAPGLFAGEGTYKGQKVLAAAAAAPAADARKGR